MKEEEIEELFTLGLLHDIGYEFLEEKDYRNHNIIGGEMLKTQGYKLWQEVYYHSIPNAPYKSKYLDLLNWADAHIDKAGNFVLMEDRLKELSDRFNTPVEKLDCYPLMHELNEKGFK